MRGDVIEMCKHTHNLYKVPSKPFQLDSDESRRNNGYNVIEMCKYTHNIYKVLSKPFQLNNDELRRNNGYKLFKTRCATPTRRNFFGNIVPEVLECTTI